MSKHSMKPKKSNQRFEKLVALCHCAALALGVSDGEFWVCFGSPFILQSHPRK